MLHTEQTAPHSTSLKFWPFFPTAGFLSSPIDSPFQESNDYGLDEAYGCYNFIPKHVAETNISLQLADKS